MSICILHLCIYIQVTCVGRERGERGERDEHKFMRKANDNIQYINI